ncbi:hypothetical protein M9Y10_045626 [Tritrichomonas musculus]|uniref:Uncharacterized protein n=1 Tax=Tritrichomonas musculus TaxID=1915356 RepID=A0ABR2JVR7_9EUKA
MQNITLVSLSLLSFFSVAPFYTINNNNHIKSSFLLNSHFSHILSHVVYANTEHHSTTIMKNNFIHTLNTPLVFTSELYSGLCVTDSKCCVKQDYDFQPGTTVQNQTINGSDFKSNVLDHRPFFESDSCGDLKISQCNFLNCYTSNYFGGGISVSADLEVILHNCVFDSCTSQRHGAGGAIGKELAVDEEKHEPGLEDAKKLDIQYTCFSNNYQTDDGEGFGSALIMAATDIVFFYASTVNCPNGKTEYGAQFDIKATGKITSQFVNATGGNSKYCGAMEYRSAKDGFFQFQTLTNNRCKYVSSFTSVKMEKVDITSCNVNDNTVQGDTSDNNVPCLIFIREKSIKVTNFYFFRNNFSNGARIAERDINKGKANITLDGCYADFAKPDDWNQDYVSYLNCKFTNPIEKTFPLRQLQLGHCEGDIPPGPMIISSFFTASSPFTQSSVFSKSDLFTPSKKFTGSKPFTPSSKFTGSKSFTSSGKFTMSGLFTASKKFTDSKPFTQSSKFTDSKSFTPSGKFTDSKPFTPSSKFTDSKSFTPSGKFTDSKPFTPSAKFTGSKSFTPSGKFTDSKSFTPSGKFTDSKPFTPSAKFTKSDSFTASKKFTDSKPFTQSAKFTKSDKFTESKPFTPSHIFTPSYKFDQTLPFTLSKPFTPSDKFTASSPFTQSGKFTASHHFTKSDKFTSSSPFTQTDKFTASSHFTKSDEFTASSPFTKSDVFTASSVFTKSDSFTKSSCFTNSNNFTESSTMEIPVAGVNSDKSNKTTVIGAAAGSVGGAAIIAALVAFFVIKKKRGMLANDAGLFDEINPSITVDNDLNQVMNQDDPFADEFI